MIPLVDLGGAPIKEVGPWNIYDNWRDPVAKCSMWKDLPRGKPEAKAAFFDNYNGRKDEFDQEVSLTPRASTSSSR